MFYSIDRFEENFALLISDEDGSQVIVDRNCIPCEAGEGSVLIFSGGQYTYAPEETEKRRREFFLRIKNLSKK